MSELRRKMREVIKDMVRSEPNRERRERSTESIRNREDAGFNPDAPRPQRR